MSSFKLLMRVICHGNVKKCVVFTSCVRLFAIPWAIAHQNPLPMGFPRQEYWSDLPSPPPQMWIHKLAIISRETMRELQLLFITMALIQFWMKVYIHSFLIMTVLNSRPPHPPNSWTFNKSEWASCRCHWQTVQSKMSFEENSKDIMFSFLIP